MGVRSRRPGGGYRGGILVIGVSLAVNELVQTSLGHRSPAIPPNDRMS